jgi:hypothetical protein
MKRVRAVVDADLGRTPRTVNMLLLVEDDEDTLTRRLEQISSRRQVGRTVLRSLRRIKPGHHHDGLR